MVGLAKAPRVLLAHPFLPSTYIYFSEDTRATRVSLPIYVGSVPAEHLDTFDQKLKASLERIVKEGIDMERMAMVIKREERQVNSSPQLLPTVLHLSLSSSEAS